MAKKRILEAITRGEKVIVYGDYDCDGVMSTSVIVKSIKMLGGKVAGYLPCRYIDGYGINLNNAKRIAESGYNLVICVDNGVSAHEALDYLKERKIDVLIIDHHEILSDLPPCLACIHPDTIHYGEYPVSAGYLSAIFSVYLLDRKDDYLITLGALSTLSDMMPLKGHNREIVRLAIDYINDNQYQQISGFVGKRHIDEKTLSMDLIPAINAIGRMSEDTSINRLIPYFTDDDLTKIERIGVWMKEVNMTRKEMTKQAGENIVINEEDPGILAVSDLPEGLNGLLANKLMEKYKRPTVVFSSCKSDSSLLVGSMRSKDGFSVVKAYETLKNYLVKGGGHEFAGGLSIKKEDLESFKKEFFFLCLKHKFEPIKEDLIPLSYKEITKENFDLVMSFGPFGMEWKEPKFRVNNIPVESLTFTRDGRFLSTQLSGGIRLFSFSLGTSYFSTKNLVDLKVSFARSEYRGVQGMDAYAEEI
ncbi:MAG: DHH family phosphoesterase [Bacilli bacterium]|nr:DHH family phosphoesterase [Bacilli bacterium]